MQVTTAPLDPDLGKQQDENEAEGRKASNASRKQQLDRLKITLKTTKSQDKKGISADARVLLKSEMYEKDSRERSLQRQPRPTKDVQVGTTLSHREDDDLRNTQELTTLLCEDIQGIPLDPKGSLSPQATLEKSGVKQDLIVKMPRQTGSQLESPILIQSIHPERGSRLSPKFKKLDEKASEKTIEKLLHP